MKDTEPRTHLRERKAAAAEETGGESALVERLAQCAQYLGAGWQCVSGDAVVHAANSPLSCSGLEPSGALPDCVADGSCATADECNRHVVRAAPSRRRIV